MILPLRVMRYKLKIKEGFILLELIIVIFILGILSVLVLPGFRSFYREISIDKASRRLSQNLRFAHFRSVSEERKYRVFFDLENKKYWMEKASDEEGSFEKIASSLFKERKLPKDIEFFKITTPRGEKQFLGKAYLDFSPDGSSENCLILLENKEKNMKTILVKAPTSRVIIYDYEYEDTD